MATAAGWLMSSTLPCVPRRADVGTALVVVVRSDVHETRLTRSQRHLTEEDNGCDTNDACL